MTTADSYEHGGNYEIDERYREKFGFNITENPNGYLRRK
jgi:cephalosporin hydroxylase